jgi:hypothetical protein
VVPRRNQLYKVLLGSDKEFLFCEVLNMAISYTYRPLSITQCRALPLLHVRCGPSDVNSARNLKQQKLLVILKFKMSSHNTQSVPELATACQSPGYRRQCGALFLQVENHKDLAYIRSAISQNRLDDFTLLAKENECAKRLIVEELKDTVKLEKPTS